MTQTNEPKLDPPGAGLPLPMLLVAKCLFAFKCKTGNQKSSLENFSKEHTKISELIEPVSNKKRSKRVLVPMLPGLEDSSRYYSIWMTLDHLRITNSLFSQAISKLSKEHTIKLKVDTAAVKPDPNVTESVENEYTNSCEKFISTIETLGNLKTNAELYHPWFGSLNAYRWLSLASMHMSIHRRQISSIIKRL